MSLENFVNCSTGTWIGEVAMVDDLDRWLRRIRDHLDSASDYAERAKKYANAGNPTSVAPNVRQAVDEIESAITIVNRLRRETR